MGGMLDSAKSAISNTTMGAVHAGGDAAQYVADSMKPAQPEPGKAEVKATEIAKQVGQNVDETNANIASKYTAAKDSVANSTPAVKAAETQAAAADKMAEIKANAADAVRSMADKIEPGPKEQ